MLSDEEKKAIEYWQYIRDTQIYDGYKGQVYAVTLINIIEKQQKEIERLEKKVKRYEKIIEHKDEKCEQLLEFVETEKETDYVSKDKIKAKIEEIDFMIKEINQGHLQKYTVGELLSAKRFLQSLLEKE